MIVHTKLHENFNTGLWPKYAVTKIKLYNIMINPHKEKCAQEKLYKKLSEYAKYFINFVEMGVLRSTASVKAKHEDRDLTCMLLGYEQNNTGDKYHMFNSFTECIVPSCDIKRLIKTYG